MRRLEQSHRQRLRHRNWLVAAVIAVALALCAVGVVLSLQPKEQPAPPDPHEGQVYVHDGFGMVWMTPHNNLNASNFRRWEFKQLPRRAAYVGTQYATRQGVDLSTYQSDVDWAAVADDGIEYAILRIGYRGYASAKLQPDDTFDRHYSGARQQGLDVGVYFFSQALTEEEGAQEAEYLLELLDGREVQLPIYFDWEPVEQPDARTLYYDHTYLTDSALAFCRTIEEAGYEAGIYINRQQGYYHYDISRLGDYALWVADLSNWPDFYYRHHMWQYSFTGQVNGISGPVDLNMQFLPQNT